MDYALDRLGPDEFEHVVQALSLAVLGHGVTVFGDGPDGGREATFNGSVPYPSDVNCWNGYGVIQAKYREHPMAPADNAAWLADALRREMAKWKQKKNGDFVRSPRPAYYLVATNVRLSSVQGSGGVDTIRTQLDKHAADLALQGYDLWDYDKMCRLLDGQEPIRRTYAGFITTGDLLTTVEQLVGQGSVEAARVLRKHAALEIGNDKFIRASDSGLANDRKYQLASVAIDLPGTIDGREVTALQAIVQAGNRQLSDSGEASAVLIIGGPGQGKSTLGRIACQIYRAAFLDGSAPLGGFADVALSGWAERIGQLGIDEIANRRWPIRVDLAKFGDAVAGGREVSVLRHVAELISQTGVEVTPNMLNGWLPRWPWLIVFDGLDEVPDLANRRDLMRQIEAFVATAAGADVLYVVTTRPLGYNGEFNDLNPVTCYLTELSPTEAEQYAAQLLLAQHPDDPQLMASIRVGIRMATRSPATAKLMKSPLQVAIMTLLLEQRERLPQSRHQLFDEYLEATYSRESRKGGRLGQLLTDYKDDVLAIHQQVGIELQASSEISGGADASMPEAEVLKIAFEQLIAKGHADESARSLASELTRASRERLVLLSHRTQGQVGFDVRSLQEFLAARAISDTDLNTTALPMIALTAAPSHWHNTWLFAVGRIFARHPHAIGDVLDQMSSLDSLDGDGGWCGWFAKPAASAAVDLLDENLTRNNPNAQRRLIELSLGILDVWPNHDDETTRAAHVLFSVAQSSELLWRPMFDKVKTAANIDGPGQRAAHILLLTWSRATGPLATQARQQVHLLGIDKNMDVEPDNAGWPSRLVAAFIAAGVEQDLSRYAGAISTADMGQLLVTAVGLLSEAQHRTAIAKYVHDRSDPIEGALLRRYLLMGLRAEPVGQRILQAIAP